MPGPRPGLTASNRRVTAFVAVDDRRAGDGFAEITYWLYRPTMRLGAGRAQGELGRCRRARRDAAAGDRRPGAGRARDPAGRQPLRVRRRRGAALAVAGTSGADDAHQWASWCSMTPNARSSSRPPGQGAAEGAERLAVGVLDEGALLLLAALALGRELEPPAVERDRLEALEGHRPRLARPPVDPDRALGALGRVVDAADQVPADVAAVGRPPDPGRPVPDRVLGVIAARFVLDPARLAADPPLADPHVAFDRHDPLARPDIAAALSPVGQTDSTQSPSPTRRKARTGCSSSRRRRLDADQRAALSGAQSMRPVSSGPAASVQTSPRATGPSRRVRSRISAASRSQTAQNVWPSGPTPTRAAQSSSSSEKAPR